MFFPPYYLALFQTGLVKKNVSYPYKDTVNLSFSVFMFRPAIITFCYVIFSPSNLTSVILVAGLFHSLTVILDCHMLS